MVVVVYVRRWWCAGVWVFIGTNRQVAVGRYFNLVVIMFNVLIAVALELVLSIKPVNQPTSKAGLVNIWK